MARKISGASADAETLEWARRIAEAQVDLNRVRNSRRRLITRFFVDLSYQPLKSADSSFGSRRFFSAIVPAPCLSKPMRLVRC